VISLSEEQYKEIQSALKWDMAERLPDGRVLGDSEKTGWVKEGPDHKISFLAQRVALHDKTVLELGSYEGDLTVQLARVSKAVTGIEVRPSNIICALTRAFVHEISNAKFVMRDVQDLDESFGTFDVLFHAGLLYHFQDPVKHLIGASKISDILLLNTHYYSDELGFERSDIVHEGKTYKAALYKEYGPAERLSGVDAYSRWLYREDLLELVRAAGYDQIEVARDLSTVSGPKITLLAQRTIPLVRVAQGVQQADQPMQTEALEATKKLFEAAKVRAEYEEKEYRRRANELKSRLAELEKEQTSIRQERDYYEKYSADLAQTVQNITNGKLWRFSRLIHNLF
jgi:hypothetical protein